VADLKIFLKEIQLKYTAEFHNLDKT